jgi:hypothetical protein
LEALPEPAPDPAPFPAAKAVVHRVPVGVPRKAGHFIASMTYRHGRLPLAGPGQLLDLG